MGGNHVLPRLWPGDCTRFDDARAEAEKRQIARNAAAERGLWALADLYMPADIREAGERWKIPHALEEMWRAAFIAGWRAALGAETQARMDMDVSARLDGGEG